MQGEDKPLIEFNERPMIEHVLDAMPPGRTTLISANRNLERYRAYGETFTDRDVGADLSDLGTPLVGVLGGLERCERDWLLVSPGDTPLLRPGWEAPLVRAVASSGVPGAVIHDGERQQHLHLYLSPTLASSLRRYLRLGGLSAHGWIAEAGLVPAVTPSSMMFKNMNRREDLDAT